MFLCCGEALIDVFSNHDVETNNLSLVARPGGTPYNVAIAIARLGGQSALLTGISSDSLGQHLYQSLKNESVATDYLIRRQNPTALSLISVDQAGQPGYTFYGSNCADSSITRQMFPKIGSDVTGLHFASYSIVMPPAADAFLELAAELNDRFISIDPNVRPTVFPNIETWRARIDRFAEFAQLLKVSKEDLQYLYPGVVVEKIAERYLAKGVNLVVITDGDQAVSAWTQYCQVVRVKPLPTKVVDTVGAGDTFQAALLVKLFEMGAGCPEAAIEALDEDQIHDLLSFANQAARLTCLKRGADSPHRSELSRT